MILWRDKNMVEMVLDIIYKTFVAIVISIIAYIQPFLIPFQTIVYLFLVDIVFGYLDNKKNNKEKFSTRKLFNKAFPRLIVSMVAISLGFELDKFSPSSLTEVNQYLTWITMLFYTLNIMKNMYNWSGEKLILKMMEFLKNKSNNNLDK